VAAGVLVPLLLLALCGAAYARRASLPAASAVAEWGERALLGGRARYSPLKVPAAAAQGGGAAAAARNLAGIMGGSGSGGGAAAAGPPAAAASERASIISAARAKTARQTTFATAAPR
jgi:hypothetical protein